MNKIIKKLPDSALGIMTRLKNSNFCAYAVGGCVRDMLIGKETTDWDFTTNATPDEILRLFPDGFYDNKFGTVGIPVKSGGENVNPEIFEITTYRSEQGYSDHRHPDKITWGDSLDEDLKRRDFTINSMAFDGNNIIDLFCGQEDLKNKLIRAVGNADERFKEDALRMMRAVRFSTQLGFTIENSTFSAMEKNSALISRVSGERIREEILKILKSDFPAQGVKLLRNAKILSVILPELEKCFGVEQKSPQRHHVYDVGTHLIKSLEACPSTDPIVRLATLLHDIGKAVTYNKTAEGIITFYNHEIIGTSIVRNIADRLRFSKKDRDRLVTLVRYHQFTVEENQTDSAVRRFIRNIGRENIDDMLALRTGDRLGGGARQTSWRTELFKKRIIQVQKQPFTVADLKVDGHDVMKVYHCGPGKLIGAVLSMLFDDVVEKKIKNEPKALLKRLNDLHKESSISASPIPPREPEAVRH